jgi:hypothetical protein
VKRKRRSAAGSISGARKSLQKTRFDDARARARATLVTDAFRIYMYEF